MYLIPKGSRTRRVEKTTETIMEALPDNETSDVILLSLLSSLVNASLANAEYEGRDMRQYKKEWDKLTPLILHLIFYGEKT